MIVGLLSFIGMRYLLAAHSGPYDYPIVWVIELRRLPCHCHCHSHMHIKEKILAIFGILYNCLVADRSR